VAVLAGVGLSVDSAVDAFAVVANVGGLGRIT
jgi:hypothetical protein